MNLAKLNGAIAEKSISEKKNMKITLAKELGISPQALGKKLSGKSRITTNDAQIIADLLCLDYSERVEIFLPISSQK